MGVGHEYRRDFPQPILQVAALPDPRHRERIGAGQDYAICGYG